MKTKLTTLFLILLYPAFSPTAGAQTVDSWTDTAAGTFKWETGSEWSLGVPPSVAPSSIMITNVSVPMPHQNRQKTVEIDSTTVASFPDTMTISNLTVSAPTFNQNTLFVNNTGSAPLHIISSLNISNHGVVSIANSVVLLDDGRSQSHLGFNGVFDDGLLQFNGGTLITTNVAGFSVGYQGVGQMTVLDGTWLAGTVTVGERGFESAQGTLTLAGGTNIVGQLAIGIVDGATGVVSMTGGILITTNGETDVGFDATGQMTVSDGTWLAGDVYVGAYSDAGLSTGQGTLTLAGGTTVISGDPGFNVANDENTTGTVWLTGGQLITTNVSTVLGGATEGINLGQMTVSNGTWQARDVTIGAGAKPQGNVAQAKLRIDGGTTTVSSNLLVGNCPYDTIGLVTVYRGALYITNATHTAVLDVENGTVTVEASGMLVADVIAVTNSCGVLFNEGGIINYRTLILDPNDDADLDGLPNGWEQMYGLDPLDPFFDNGPYGDPDGDGVSNLDEFTLGTNPINPHDPYRITAITRETNDIRITWQYVPPPFGALSNCVVEASPTVTGTWTNVSGTMTMPSAPLAILSTNYLDVGGATNKPSRFYRVRLVP